jgi:hypothetical protein
VCFEQGYLTDMAAWQKFTSEEWPEVGFTEADAAGFDEYTMRRRGIESLTDQVSSSASREPRPHRVVELQGLVETRKKQNGRPVYESRLVQILDDRYIVKNERLASWNGKPEYIVFEPMTDPGGDRPIGVIETIENLLYVLNDYVNIATDNARKVMESPLLVDWTMTKQMNFFLGPAAINWVRNPTQAVAPFPMKDLPRSFYELIGFYNDLIQRITGVSDYFGGLNTGDTEKVTQTARGMQLMANLAASRFSPILAKMDHELYRPLAMWIHETAKIRMEGSDMVRLPWNPDCPFSRVGPGELDATLEYAFNTKALDAALGQRRQDFIQMMGLLNEILQTPQAQMQGVTLDLYETTRMLMDRFEMRSEADVILKRLPTMPQVAPGGPEATPGQPSMPGRPVPPAMPQGAPGGMQPMGPMA